MKKFLTFALVAVLALGAGSVAYASVCSLDPVPAATLLYPFVVYDYNGGTNGQTTLFSVTNVSATAQIVHFTLWSDYSYHVLDWNVILSGYDVQSTNIRDILVNGTLPVTGTGVPPTEIGVAPNSATVLAEGPAANHAPTYNIDNGDDTHSIAARCPVDSVAPWGNPAAYGTPIPQSVLDLMKDFLQASQTSARAQYDCATDNFYNVDTFWFENRDTTYPTWMYITADVVYTCNRLFPDTDAAQYWNGTLPATPDPRGPQAMFDNVLMGDIFYVSNADRLSEAVPAVAIEADPSFEFSQTFYGRYTAGADFREPLPNTWGFRYLGANAVGDWMDTNVRVFKMANEPIADDYGLGAQNFTVADLNVDLTLPSEMYAINCRGYAMYVWDEDENVIEVPPSGNPWSPPDTGKSLGVPNQLPLETQEVSMNELPHVDDNGWAMITWPGSMDGDGYGYQSYVSVKFNAFGKYSAATPGTVLGNTNCSSFIF